MQPLVSIIIPVYNSQKYIHDTIESCLVQSYDDLEIIIVDDGSTDKSAEVIKGFKDERIRYYKIKNNGPCFARNLGISISKGQLLQFLDADDILDEGKIQNQINQYVIYGERFVYSGIMGSITADKKRLEKGFGFYYKDLNPKDYFRGMFKNFGKYYTTGMWMIPRSLVEKTHGWNEKVSLNNDGEFFSRIILLSGGIKFCSKAIFYYRRDVPNSISKRFDSKEIYESWLYSYSCYVEYFQLTLDKNSAKALGRKALSVYYCNSYPHYPDLLMKCKSQLMTLGYKHPVAHGGKIFKLLSGVIGVENALKLRTLKDRRRSRIKTVKAA